MYIVINIPVSCILSSISRCHLYCHQYYDAMYIVTNTTMSCKLSPIPRCHVYCHQYHDVMYIVTNTTIMYIVTNTTMPCILSPIPRCRVNCHQYHDAMYIATNTTMSCKLSPIGYFEVSFQLLFLKIIVPNIIKCDPTPSRHRDDLHSKIYLRVTSAAQPTHPTVVSVKPFILKPTPNTLNV